MKTYNLFGTDFKIEIKGFCAEGNEWCVYYYVHLKNKNGEELTFGDFDYSDTKEVDEDYLFHLFLSRGSDCFENAIDCDAWEIDGQVFLDFLGEDWVNSIETLRRISKN